MCGRTTLVRIDPEDLRDVFGVTDIPALVSRYNIAPSQPQAVILDPKRIELLTWGPSFINAKIEGVTTKPLNRCLIVIDGFYEWRRGDRHPFYFRRKDKKPFAVGGVRRTKLASCVLVTCPATAEMKDLHHRQPLVVPKDDWQRWRDGEKLIGTLEDFERYEVSTLVNSPKNEDPRCIDPA